MPLMKCGCRASGTNAKTNKPVCVVHAGLTPDAEIIVETPNLAGREAKCAYCSNKKPSSLSLPYFVYHSNQCQDEYYCGCFGWD